MNSLSNFNELFSQTACQYKVYSMGRFIQPVEKKQFIGFEQTLNTWPAPFRQHAWLAILFWPNQGSNNQQHYVWFIKLPLDEQAKLDPVGRDDFIRRIIDVLGKYLQIEVQPAQDPAQKLHFLEGAMKDNPYGFTPTQEQLANFHALAQKLLNLPPSGFYTPALEYLGNSTNFQHWHELGYQGLADCAARLDETVHDQPLAMLVADAIQSLPAEPLAALASCLEHHCLPTIVNQAIKFRIETELQQQPVNTLLIANTIRATAQSHSREINPLIFRSVLNSSVKGNLELLAAIASRCWQHLQQQETLKLFLEALAVNDQGQYSFNAILADLMFIPGMRENIFQQFRSSSRSEALVLAIGDFFNQFHK